MPSSYSVLSSKDRAASELSNLVEDAQTLLRNAGSYTADQIDNAKSSMFDKLGEVKSYVTDKGGAVIDGSRRSIAATDEYVRDHPWQMVAVAAAAGVLIGAALTRNWRND